MTEELALFPSPEPVGPDGAAEILRARWQAALDVGQHPLAVALRGSIRLHPDAPRDLDGAGDGPRCGGCGFRVVVNSGTARSFPKCTVDRPARITHGSGTDVRRYWPACERFDPQGRLVDGADTPD